MSKELIIAICVGICMGAVVTYGIYTANQAILNKQRGQVPQTTTIPTPSSSPQQPLTITLVQPPDYVATTKDSIILVGTTEPQTVVAITTENTALFVESDSSGSFSQEVELVKGSNTIKIAASDGVRISNTAILHAVYSTQLESL